MAEKEEGTTKREKGGEVMLTNSWASNTSTDEEERRTKASSREPPPVFPPSLDAIRDFGTTGKVLSEKTRTPCKEKFYKGHPQPQYNGEPALECRNNHTPEKLKYPSWEWRLNGG